MSEVINQLIEAVEISPENIPLRLHLAEQLMNEGLYTEATVQFTEVLNRSYGNPAARRGLANTYYRQKKHSAAIIIYEDLMKEGQLSWEQLLQYTRSLVKEDSLHEAVKAYAQVLNLNPGFKDAELDTLLRAAAQGPAPYREEDDEEANYPDAEFQSDEDFFMEKPDISFKDVGGMQSIKNEISMKIIQPLKNPELFRAFGKKTGGGILMYGPPGCGKTFLARATAGEIDAKFINIGLHDILDMWMGNSERNLHEVFEQARANTPCVLFFDEVDSLGASRHDLRQSSMKQVINQFLAEMDGVASSNEGVLILAATNAPWSIDGAFRRPGRFDRVLFVGPPDQEGRIEIINRLIEDKPTEKINASAVAKITEGYSGADLKAVVDIASERKLEESIASGELKKITEKDLLNAVKQHRATTAEWFSTARNYALYANETGLYDDILAYLKISK